MTSPPHLANRRGPAFVLVSTVAHLRSPPHLANRRGPAFVLVWTVAHLV
jgi:ribosomal protein L39E